MKYGTGIHCCFIKKKCRVNGWKYWIALSLWFILDSVIEHEYSEPCLICVESFLFCWMHFAVTFGKVLYVTQVLSARAND